ncbi:putative poly(ADP-ribose) glycohydrolase [Trypanosoma conorhini]|uniref:poly(ADP-ribose) glycohydrolase n=1 Tax=Trypanosoma conorhini TaxID=83891 RepID=A0A422Q0Q5_9TRYP|nr:putative poly(ADP-ribose) glycohydrolase [Trypanosoma conorhini]RNF23287.1 putative poly(ADP-ribose) glycohydrolase [Trypanosoma conorhini]
MFPLKAGRATTAASPRLRQRTLDSFLVPKGPTAPVAVDSASHECCRVTLPWSKENRCCENAGHVCNAWEVIISVLAEDASQNTDDLQLLLQKLCFCDSFGRLSSMFHFGMLCHVVDHLLTPSERAAFFDVTLPWMKRLVREGPVTLPHDLEALLQGTSRRLMLTHEEAVTLLVCGFFSLFPGRCFTSNSRRASSCKLAPFNFADLFCTASPARLESNCAKIRCLLEYFIYWSHHTSPVKTCLEFYRVCFASFPDFGRSSKPMENICMDSKGRIEDNYGKLQVDFANKVLGGGVLQTGCVQEEIQFVTCPELLLSRLLSEPLLDTEALFMSGAGRYSLSEGYAGGFRFVRGQSPHVVVSSVDAGIPRETCVEFASTPLRDKKDGSAILMPNSCVVAMDAVNFQNRVGKQYTASSLTRETRKAFVAFKGATDSTLPSVHSGPVATGNWGCGAFGGDRQLKLMIQWCAASEAQRSLIYSTFNDESLCCQFRPVYEKLQREKWSVGNVFMVLLAFSRYCTTSPTPSVGEGKLFQYILSLQRSLCELL